MVKALMAGLAMVSLAGAAQAGQCYSDRPMTERNAYLLRFGADNDFTISSKDTPFVFEGTFSYTNGVMEHVANIKLQCANLPKDFPCPGDEDFYGETVYALAPKGKAVIEVTNDQDQNGIPATATILIPGLWGTMQRMNRNNQTGYFDMPGDIFQPAKCK